MLNVRSQPMCPAWITNLRAAAISKENRRLKQNQSCYSLSSYRPVPDQNHVAQPPSAVRVTASLVLLERNSSSDSRKHDRLRFQNHRPALSIQQSAAFLLRKQALFFDYVCLQCISRNRKDHVFLIPKLMFRTMLVKCCTDNVDPDPQIGCHVIAVLILVLVLAAQGQGREDREHACGNHQNSDVPTAR